MYLPGNVTLAEMLARAGRTCASEPGVYSSYRLQLVSVELQEAGRRPSYEAQPIVWSPCSPPQPAKSRLGRFARGMAKWRARNL